jgi:hypothetical protein
VDWYIYSIRREKCDRIEIKVTVSRSLLPWGIHSNVCPLPSVSKHSTTRWCASHLSRVGNA